MATKISDGSTASYYELPPEATELQHVIAFKNMNGQIAEIFRACMRYGEVAHSDMLRDINKMIFYAQAEKERLLKYEYQGNVEEGAKLQRVPSPETEVERILGEGTKGTEGTRSYPPSNYSLELPHPTKPSEGESSYVKRAEAEAARKHQLAMKDSARTYQEFEEKHNG